jgi:heme/copper-type cytochrome/quinol oxidase subunit 2
MGKASTDNRFVTWKAGTISVAATALATWTPQALAAESERIVEAFNWTVVFLMAMPYATVACCAGWIVYRYTRSHRAREDEQAQLHIVKKGEC